MHTLDLLTDMAGRSFQPQVPVVADMSDTPEVGKLISRLDRARHNFIIAVHPRMLRAGEDQVQPDGRRRRREPGAHTAEGRPDAPLAWSRHAATVMRADGTFRHAHVRSALLSQPSRPGEEAGGDRRVYRLFTEPAPEGHPASPVWLTNLVHHRLDELLELTRFHMSSTITAHCLEERFDLLGFAGRSFPAWHHHMTMASAAYAYMRIGRAGHPDAPLAVRQGL
jgi:hypothetical protein